MTGHAIFVQDMNPDGLLYGALVRPPTYVASLVDVDAGAAEAMPGVVAVVRNGSFLGVVAEREDQAHAAATALGKSAEWKVESVLPGNDGLFDWLQNAPNEEKEIRESGARGWWRSGKNGRGDILSALPDARLDRHVGGSRPS